MVVIYSSFNFTSSVAIDLKACLFNELLFFLLQDGYILRPVLKRITSGQVSKLEEL